jgi:hypothetical protein
MRIDSLPQLHDWVTDQTRGIVAGLPPAQAAEVVESAAGVIWRHAFGQGLRPGDDWGWILAQYDQSQLQAVAAAALEPPAAGPGRRRQ